MRRALAAGTLLAILPTTAALADEPAEGPEQAFQITDERITESSGLARSTVHEDIVYTVNDSGHGAYVYALDGDGTVAARLEIGDVAPVDWEAVAPGPAERIWVGDIGDNQNARDHVTLYRFREPDTLRDQSVEWTRFRLEYEDGPHNAEALLVHPMTGRVFVVTKATNGGAIYSGPAELNSQTVNTLTKVADAPPLVTGAAFAPEDSALVLRTYLKGHVYEHPSWNKIGELPTSLQPQGESVTITSDGLQALFGSEGANSWVYQVPMSAMASSVAPATPSPSPSPTRTPQEGPEPDDEGGGLDSLLGGLPWWVPGGALAIALFAGVAAFPRTRRSS